MRRLWRDLVPLGLLMLFPLLLFAGVTLGGKTLLPADALYLFQPFEAAAEEMGVGEVQNPLLSDLILENYPWKQFVRDAIRSRELPLWDPYVFSGHPFLANGQHSALYPLSLLFFVLPLPKAFGVFVVVQLGLAGASMYFFTRVLRAHPIGGLIAGLCFQLSGFMVVSVVHPMIIAGASWLPLILALIECAVTRRRFWAQQRATLPWILLGAVALGLQALAGHAETTYFVLLVMGGFAGWRLCYRLLTLPREKWRAEVASPALGLMLLVLLGLGLGAAQLIPFYEVAQASFRQDAVSLQEVLAWAYPIRRIITFFVPDFFGNPVDDTVVNLFTGEMVRATRNAHGEAISSFDWGIKNYVEGGAYLGILPLLLALVAVIRPPFFRLTVLRGYKARLGAWIRQPYVPFLTALTLFSLASVFGTPIYALVYALPFLDQSHSPFRWIFPLTVAVAALAGLGATTIVQTRLQRGLVRGSAPKATRSDRRSWSARVLLFNTAPDVVSVIGSSAIWGGLAVVLTTVVSRLIFDRIEGLVAWFFWSMAKAPGAFPDHRIFYAYLFPKFLTFGAFLLCSGIVLRVSRCPIWLPRRIGGRPVWEALAVMVLAVDLLLFGAGFNPAVDPKLLNYRPPVVDFLRADPEIWRFSTFDPKGHRTFDVNTGMFYDLQDVRGYDSLFSAQYVRYMSWIEPQGQLLYNRIAPFAQFSSLDSPLTDLLNVKYIVTEEEIPLPKYQLVYEDEAVRVYENLGAVPRAFTLPASSTLAVPDGEAVGEAVLRYDPRHYTIVEEQERAWIGSAGLALPTGADPNAGVPLAQSIISYGINEVVIDVKVDDPSWLILTDAFAPGWKAFVRPPGTAETEERRASIARIAGNFRGVPLDDSAIVRFKYSPNSVKVGVFVSFLSGMVIAFLGVVWTWRLVYRDRPEQSTVQRLAKNSVVPIALNLFNRVVDFAFAALMLRILGPGNVGDYYTAGTIFIWFNIFTNFGLNTYLTREVARRPERVRRYLFNTTLIRLVLSLVGVPLLLGYLGVRQTVVASLTSPASAQAMWAIVLLYVGLVPSSISTGLTALFYAFEKAEYPAVITSVSTLAKVIIQTVVLVVGWGIVGLAGSTIVINIITLALLTVLAGRLVPGLHRAKGGGLRLRSVEASRLRRQMVRASWPLMLNELLAMLFFKVDVSLMEPILGSEAVGLYSIGYKFLEALMIVPSMFTLALFPIISRQAAADREALARFYRLGTKILIILVLPAALVATVAARDMVLVLGGAEYLPGAAVVLRLVAWSMPFGWINSITQYVLIALDEQRYLTRAYAAVFLFTLISNLLLMPRFGYRASALLHIASELLLLIPFLIGVRRRLGDIGWWQVLGKPLLIATVSGACAFALLTIGRGPAVLGLAILYPLLIWRLNVLTSDERRILSPLFSRGRSAHP